MNIYAPITKTEKMEDGRLKVYGVATSETLDKDKEIIDYGSAKAAMLEWPGNIREQHDAKKAVGRALNVSPLDDSKAVELEAFISSGAQDTQAKVLDGTLSGFSIAGQSERKVPEVVKTDDGEVQAMRIFMKRISEVSLVDSPANPSCTFSILKADAQEEPMAEPTEATPAPEAAAEVTKYDGGEIADCMTALQALSFIEGLLLVETNEAHPEPPEQIASLKAAIAGLKAFIASEIQEESEEVAEADKPADVAKDAGSVSLCYKMGDMDACQKAHDKCVEHGAKCAKTDVDGSLGIVPAKADDPPPDVTKTDEAPQPAPEAGLFVSKLEALEKRLADFDVAKADFETYRKEAEAEKAGLKAEVKKLSETIIEPGRPVFKGTDGKPTFEDPAKKTPEGQVICTVDEVQKAIEGLTDSDQISRALMVFKATKLTEIALRRKS